MAILGAQYGHIGAQRGPGGPGWPVYAPVDVRYRAPGRPLEPRRPPEPPGIQGLRGARECPRRGPGGGSQGAPEGSWGPIWPFGRPLGAQYGHMGPSGHPLVAIRLGWGPSGAPGSRMAQGGFGSPWGPLEPLWALGALGSTRESQGGPWRWPIWPFGAPRGLLEPFGSLPGASQGLQGPPGASQTVICPITTRLGRQNRGF